MSSRSDLLWIIDEAFVEYAGTETEASVLQRLPKNGIVLRSLTKFHAVPGVRLGYLAADAELAQAIRDELPAWSVNAFALAAAQAVFADTSDFAAQTRAENAERRADTRRRPVVPAGNRGLPVSRQLRSVPLARRAPQSARHPPQTLRHRRPRLLQLPRAQRRLMVPCRRPLSRRPPPPCRSPLRNPGNDARGFLLPAPRNPGFTRIRQQGFNKHKSLRKRRDGGWGKGGESPSPEGFLLPSPAYPRRPRHTPALMLQGTSSNAGKSILAAAYCRIFRQDGYSVAPFKAQNMSLNSGVTAGGRRDGPRPDRAGAGRPASDPDARMNPILLKPHSDTGSQVVVLGQPIGTHGRPRLLREKEGTLVRPSPTLMTASRPTMRHRRS